MSDHSAEPSDVSPQQARGVLTRGEQARREIRRHSAIVEQLQRIKLQAQALDTALITLAQDPEMGLERLFPACIHLDKLQMELLREIQQESETLVSLEQASAWDSRRHLEGGSLTAADREHRGEEETSERRPC